MSDSYLIRPADLYSLLTGGTIPPQLLKDLQTLAIMDAGTVNKVAESIAHVDGFLGNRGLRILVQDLLDDAVLSEAVGNILLNLEEQEIPTITQIIGSWHEAGALDSDEFPDFNMEALVANLTKLLSPYPALERARKARRLAQVTGQGVREIDIVCDARPVFDEEREKIEGFVTICTLRVAYTDDSDRQCKTEFRLNLRQLRELYEKAQIALMKLDVMEGVLRNLPEGIMEAE